MLRRGRRAMTSRSVEQAAPGQALVFAQGPPPPHQGGQDPYITPQLQSPPQSGVWNTSTPLTASEERSLGMLAHLVPAILLPLSAGMSFAQTATTDTTTTTTDTTVTTDTGAAVSDAASDAADAAGDAANAAADAAGDAVDAAGDAARLQ